MYISGTVVKGRPLAVSPSSVGPKANQTIGLQIQVAV